MLPLAVCFGDEDDKVSAHAQLQSACLTNLAHVQHALAVNALAYVTTKTHVTVLGSCQGYQQTTLMESSVHTGHTNGIMTKCMDSDSGEFFPLLCTGVLPVRKADSVRRAALASAVHVRPSSGRGTMRWRVSEREQLRAGPVASCGCRDASQLADASDSYGIDQGDALFDTDQLEFERKLQGVRAPGSSVFLETDHTVNRVVPHRSAQECEAQWSQHEDPSVQPFAGATRTRRRFVDASPWSSASVKYGGQLDVHELLDEVAALRRVVVKCGEHDWQRVVTEFTAAGFSGRNAMGCHRCFRYLVETSVAAAGRLDPEERRRFWTPEEDEALRAAVIATGSCNEWAHVARLVPGRDRQACLLRWRHAVDPTLHKGKWTQTEDSRLRDLVAQHGATNWATWVPVEMGGRSSASCRERWFNRLDPVRTRGQWGPDEDEALRTAVASLGTSKWGMVSRHRGLEGRTYKDCRERWQRFVQSQSKVGELREVDAVRVPHLVALHPPVLAAAAQASLPGGLSNTSLSEHERAQYSCAATVPHGADAMLPSRAAQQMGTAGRKSADWEAPIFRMIGLRIARESWKCMRRGAHNVRHHKHVAPLASIAFHNAATSARAAALRLCAAVKLSRSHNSFFGGDRKQRV